MNKIKDLELKHIAEVDGERLLVSTINIEVRHAWLTQHQNVNVYETMVFEKKDGIVQYDSSIFNKRYTTYENAVEGHNYIVENIKDIVRTTRECRAKII